MRKLLAIVLVLGLAGAANAEWLDDFESYSNGDTIAGSNGWLVGGVGASEWRLTADEYVAVTGAGIGGSKGVTSWVWEGVHRNVNISSGTVAINMHLRTQLTPYIGRAGFMIGQEDYGTGDNPSNGVTLNYNGGWALSSVIDGTGTNYGGYGSTVDAETYGWYEIELSVNLDNGSAYAQWRDVDDNTGLPLAGEDGDWHEIGVIPPGTVQDLPVLFYGLGTFANVRMDGGVFIDGDVGGDGLVGGSDMTRIRTNWGKTPAQRTDGDLDGNDAVGASDYQLVLDNWGNVPPAEPAEAPGAIPEPSTLLLLLSGLALLRRRRSA